jgi:hypothetical protein
MSAFGPFLPCVRQSKVLPIFANFDRPREGGGRLVSIPFEGYF